MRFSQVDLLLIALTRRQRAILNSNVYVVVEGHGHRRLKNPSDPQEMKIGVRFEALRTNALVRLSKWSEKCRCRLGEPTSAYQMRGSSS